MQTFQEGPVREGMKQNKEGGRIKLDVVTVKSSLGLIHGEEGSMASTTQQNFSLRGKRLAFVSPYQSVCAIGNWNRRVSLTKDNPPEKGWGGGAVRYPMSRVTRGRVHWTSKGIQFRN